MTEYFLILVIQVLGNALARERPMMAVQVKMLEVANINLRTLQGINRLLPMLSGSAKPMTLSELRRMIMSQTMTFAAYDLQNMVGMASLAVVYQPVGIICHVEDVVVDLEYRGQRIAEKLMRKLIASLPPDWRQLDLTSKPERTAAHRLYEGLGFVLRETGNYRLTPEAWAVNAR